MIGARYWSVGITVGWRDGLNGPAWSASLAFLDDGFCNDLPGEGSVSTEGTLNTRYYVDDSDGRGLSAALDVLIADAKALGIRLGALGAGPPALYMRGDGEDPNVDYPPDWRARLAAEEARLGWGDIRGELAPAALTDRSPKDPA